MEKLLDVLYVTCDLRGSEMTLHYEAVAWYGMLLSLCSPRRYAGEHLISLGSSKSLCDNCAALIQHLCFCISLEVNPNCATVVTCSLKKQRYIYTGFNFYLQESGEKHKNNVASTYVHMLNILFCVSVLNFVSVYVWEIYDADGDSQQIMSLCDNTR